jgi:hypothetical protein
MPTPVGRGTGRAFAIGHVNVPKDNKRSKRTIKRNNRRGAR